MASPARLHKQREEARIASERAAERQETIQGSEHELALAQLAAHKRQRAHRPERSRGVRVPL